MKTVIKTLTLLLMFVFCSRKSSCQLLASIPEKRDVRLIRSCHYKPVIPCEATEFNCGCEKSILGRPRQCIHRLWVCDGWTDCVNGADEIDCLCAPGEFQCNACDRNDSNCFPLFQCVPENKLCDGKYDCANNRDEHLEQCDNKGFQCNDGFTLKAADRCNGISDCRDGSDELKCNTFNCSQERPHRCACNQENNFTCTGPGGLCYSDHERCDGVARCPDSSDELNCTCPRTRPNRCACNQADSNTCTGNGKICYTDFERCDGKVDCPDSSDEFNCSCPRWRPNRCACNQENNNTCVERKWICYADWTKCGGDGISNCEDSSDELDCTCADEEFTCACFTSSKPTCNRRKGCISKELVNDGNPDCKSGNDEVFLKQWKRNQQCGPCTLDIVRLDNETYCRPPWCDKSTCFKAPLNTPSSKNISYHAICSSSNCSQFETTENCNKILQCSDQTIILNYNFCNGKIDCEDKSDEITDRPGFKCSSKASPTRCVLPQWNLYDDIAQCHDQSDLCFGKNGSFHCFRCLDERLIISSKQVCDGVIDCYDLSDECLCKNVTVPMCTAIYSEINPSKLQCTVESSIKCVNVNTTKVLDLVCDGVSQCENGIDESNCGSNTNTIKCRSKWGNIEATQYDGRPECADFSDECNEQSVGIPAFCGDPCHSFYALGDRYCDGFIDEAWKHLNDTRCSRGFDERDCPKRFNCTSGKKISIDVSQRCDGIADCDDGSDEEESICPGRLYCKSAFGNFLSIPKSLILNGNQDCVDGIDECPPSDDNIFSSHQELLSSLPLRIWIWIIGLSTIVGNLYVILTTVMELNNKVSNEKTIITNLIFILNLSLADILMGIYLLTVAVKTVEYSGNYCFYDHAWRSSLLCSGLGSLAILSSEASCFVMVCLLCFRLRTIFNPLSVISTRSCIKISIVIWIISFFIATIPNFAGPSFIHGVWFPTQFNYPEVITPDDVLSISCRIAVITNTSIEQSGNQWETVKVFLRNNFPQFFPKAEFGYYGTNSVCMPRFYVAYGDAGWQYSTAIITINLTCFLFVLIGYIIIYKHASKNKASLKANIFKKRVRQLQNRVARLIFSDFCCWVPICIMAYLKLAGVYISDDVYAASAVVLLPINSAINPLLYSAKFGSLLSKISHLSCFKKTA